MILIGSQALKSNWPDMKRPCADWDLMATPDEMRKLMDENPETTFRESSKFPGKYSFVDNNRRYEIDATDNLSNTIIREHPIYTGGVGVLTIGNTVVFTEIITLKTCYVFKRSHAGIPLHSDKTIADLIRITKKLCGTEENTYQFLEPEHLELLKALTDEAEARDVVRKKRINFNKPKEMFFKPAENLRQYEHDMIHDVTCRDESPLYRENLKYEDRALIDMKKFNSHTFDYKLDMVQEEAMVLGIERGYLNNRQLNEQQVYKIGMLKLINVSKGKFQKFVLDNMHLLAKPRWNYLERFIQKESEGYFNETN